MAETDERDDASPGSPRSPWRATGEASRSVYDWFYVDIVGRMINEVADALNRHPSSRFLNWLVTKSTRSRCGYVRGTAAYIIQEQVEPALDHVERLVVMVGDGNNRTARWALWGVNDNAERLTDSQLRVALEHAKGIPRVVPEPGKPDAIAFFVSNIERTLQRRR